MKKKALPFLLAGAALLAMTACSRAVLRINQRRLLAVLAQYQVLWSRYPVNQLQQHLQRLAALAQRVRAQKKPRKRRKRWTFQHL